MWFLERLVGGPKSTAVVYGPDQSNRRLLSHCTLDVSLWPGWGDLNRGTRGMREFGVFKGVHLELLGRVEDLLCVVRVGRRCR